MSTLFIKQSILDLKSILTRKKLFEITVILVAILLAGLLGHYIAGIATRQIASALTKFIVSILIGLLVGLSVGVFVHRLWNRFQKFRLRVKNMETAS